MHVIYLVRRGCKYHTDQSHRILLTRYFFYLSEGRHFDLSPLAVQWVTTRVAWSKLKCIARRLIFRSGLCVCVCLFVHIISMEVMNEFRWHFLERMLRARDKSISLQIGSKFFCERWINFQNSLHHQASRLTFCSAYYEQIGMKCLQGRMQHSLRIN